MVYSAVLGFADDANARGVRVSMDIDPTARTTRLRIFGMVKNTPFLVLDGIGTLSSSVPYHQTLLRQAKQTVGAESKECGGDGAGKDQGVIDAGYAAEDEFS